MITGCPWPSRRRRAWPRLVGARAAGRSARLAGPVILAEIGWMSMGIVDTIMVGPLGPAAIGASGMASLFFAVAIFGMGVMLGLDALVAKSYGAGASTTASAGCSRAVAGAVRRRPDDHAVATCALHDAVGLHPAVSARRRNLGILGLRALPLLLYAASGATCRASAVRPVMVALVTANLVNAFGNWVLIWGHLGLPALGTNGSAWATVRARVYMARPFLGASSGTTRRHAGTPVGRSPFDAARLRCCSGSACRPPLQMTLEVGVFAAERALAGRLDPVSSARTRLRSISRPGVHGAARLRLRGRGPRRPCGRCRATAPGALHAGWTARWAPTAMGRDGAALRAAAAAAPAFHRGSASVDSASLLAIAAVFQLFDGAQAVATGVLRGPRRHADADDHQPRRPLAARPAGRLRCLRLRLGRRRPVGRSVDRPGLRRSADSAWAWAARQWRLHCGIRFARGKDITQ